MCDRIPTSHRGRLFDENSSCGELTERCTLRQQNHSPWSPINHQVTPAVSLCERSKQHTADGLSRARPETSRESWRVFPLSMMPPDLVVVGEAAALPELGNVDFVLLENQASAREPLTALSTAITQSAVTMQGAGTT